VTKPKATLIPNKACGGMCRILPMETMSCALTDVPEHTLPSGSPSRQSTMAAIQRDMGDACQPGGESLE
jgi:hypothetical protein